MFEVWFGVALGLLIASNVALWLKLDNCYHTLTSLIKEKSAIVEKTVDMTEIREEIADTVNDFLGGLHVLVVWITCGECWHKLAAIFCKKGLVKLLK